MIGITREKDKSLLMYIFAILMTLVILILVFKLWQADLTVPFNYSGDGISTQVGIKGIIDNGWYLNNKYLGAPFGANMYDYPSSDGFILLLVKLLTLFTHNVGLITNLSFLLTFFLTTICGLYVLRVLGISRFISVSLSLIYSFLPYHLIRGEGHFGLSFYFQVPLLILIAFWIMDGEFISCCSRKFKTWDLSVKRKFIISILICIFSSGSGIYYAFFACFFFVIAGTFAFLKDKKIDHIIVSVIFISILGSGVLLNTAPSIIYAHYHGPNVNLVKRNPIETEIYGMKITQMLLPVSGHRIGFLAKKKAVYDAIAPLVNENSSVSLGLIGSIGFIGLISIALFGVIGEIRNKKAKLRQLAVLNMSGILLSTIGGFGTIFAIVISPEIRGYNRIVVFIAFLSLTTVGFLIDKLINFVKKYKSLKWLEIILPVIVLTIGIYDQTTVSDVPDYKGLSANYKNDADFINEIEHVVPSNSMIFQLPYVPFPENPPVNRMNDYDLFRGYLHSSNLRWSYGTMKGREGDAWYKTVSQQPLENMIKTLALCSFNGIYIDRYGYKDDQANILINEISQLLNEKPLISSDQRLVFFDIINYKDNLKKQYNLDAYKSAQDDALHPISFSWKGGFSDLEESSQGNWRWCSSTGEFEVINPSDKTKQVEIVMSASTGYTNFSDLVISGKDFSNLLKVNSTPTLYKKSIKVPPGKTLIKFESNAKRVEAPQDSRNLVFKVDNFKSTILSQE